MTEKNWTVDDAMAEIERVAKATWTQRANESTLSIGQINQMVEKAIADMALDVKPVQVIGVGHMGDRMEVDIITTDPKIARHLRMMQDVDYMALVDRIRENARVNGPDAVYQLTEAETEVAKRHIAPPVTLTLTFRREEAPSSKSVIGQPDGFGRFANSRLHDLLCAVKDIDVKQRELDGCIIIEARKNGRLVIIQHSQVVGFGLYYTHTDDIQNNAPDELHASVSAAFSRVEYLLGDKTLVKGRDY